MLTHTCEHPYIVGQTILLAEQMKINHSYGQWLGKKKLLSIKSESNALAHFHPENVEATTIATTANLLGKC